MTDNKLAKKDPAGLAVKVGEQTGVMAQVAKYQAMIPGVDKAFRYQYPRLGKIRNGVKAMTEGGKEYPVEVPYFVLAPELLADEKFMARLAELNSDAGKPTRIPIWLPFDHPAAVLKRSCDFWNTSGLLNCRTYDGETCTRLNKQTGEYEPGPCAYENCPDWQSKNCHWIHRLGVILPDAQGSGLWQIDTPSPNNWTTLNTELVAIFVQTRGALAGLDLLLTKEAREFQTVLREKDGTPKMKDGKAQIINKAHYMLHFRHMLTPRELVNAAGTRVVIDGTQVEGIVEDFDQDDFEVGDQPPVQSDPATGEVIEAEPVEEAPSPGEVQRQAMRDICADHAAALGKSEAQFKNYVKYTFHSGVKLADLNLDELDTLKNALQAERDKASV